jgi:hypothetical protein
MFAHLNRKVVRLIHHSHSCQTFNIQPFNTSFEVCTNRCEPLLAGWLTSLVNAVVVPQPPTTNVVDDNDDKYDNVAAAPHHNHTHCPITSAPNQC